MKKSILTPVVYEQGTYHLSHSTRQLIREKSLEYIKRRRRACKRKSISKTEWIVKGSIILGLIASIVISFVF